MSKQVNSKGPGWARVDRGWLYYAKLAGVKRGRTIKSLIEEGLELVIGDDLPDEMKGSDDLKD